MLGAILGDDRDLTWRYVVFEGVGKEAPYRRDSAAQDLGSFVTARLAMERKILDLDSL